VQCILMENLYKSQSITCTVVARVSRDRLTSHDFIATSYIDIVKTSRPGTDEAEEEGVYVHCWPTFFKNNMYLLNK